VGLVFPECPLLEPPAVEGLIRYLKALTGLRNRQALALELLRLSQLGDDLLHAVALAAAICPSIRSLKVGRYDARLGPDNGGPDKGENRSVTNDGYLGGFGERPAVSIHAAYDGGG